MCAAACHDPALEAAARRAEAVAPTPALLDAWRQLHHAAQLASEVGKAWAPPRADDSHSSFAWRDGSLVGAAIPAVRPFRAALRVDALALRLVAADGAVLAERALAGTTLAASMAWVRAEAARAAGEGARQPAAPAPDLPPHRVAEGAPFSRDDAPAFAALARLLSGADAVLRRIAELFPGEPAVRCWPHHFDLALLAVLAADAAGESSKTLGVGLAVPDAISASGYWYVSPWAREAGAAASAPWPALPAGRWIERGGSLRMAALPLDEWAGSPDPSRTLAAFLATAAGAARVHFG